MVFDERHYLLGECLLNELSLLLLVYWLVAGGGRSGRFASNVLQGHFDAEVFVELELIADVRPGTRISALFLYPDDLSIAVALEDLLYLGNGKWEQ